ncbi:methyltransferase family protein [Planctomicrobium sp. SH668]|uniref:methyltransferase family protein n=1 Tax=Planctomicrobium sp. SH668 TaxID=3448126 RepID=UPI003F5BEC94
MSGYTQPLSRLGSSPLSADLASPIVHDESIRVKQFRSYQMRIPLTAVCLLTGLMLTLLSPPSIKLGSALNINLIAAGYASIAFGILLRIWSIAYIHSRKSTSVVTTGPYSICRNPLYVGTLLTVVGYLLIIQSLTMALCFIPIILLYQFGVVPVEELVLRTRHPEAYAAYCQDVSRWFPRVRARAFAKARLVWSKAVGRELQCAGWWIAVAVLIHVVCSYREAAWWIHPMNVL